MTDERPVQSATATGPSPALMVWARRVHVGLFNGVAVGWVLLIALTLPIGANFNEIPAALLELGPEDLPRFERNLRDYPYRAGSPPGASFQYPPILVSTNQEGFRDINHAAAPTVGVNRVAIFGDSFVFGLSVQQDETVSALLASRLERAAPATWEVMNFGVPGTNWTGMGRYSEHFSEKYRPDVAIYSFICDDVSDTDSITLQLWMRQLRTWPIFGGSVPRWVERSLVLAKMARYTTDFRTIRTIPGLFERRARLVLSYFSEIAERNGHEIVLIDYCRSFPLADTVRRFNESHHRDIVVVDDFPIELNPTDTHPTPACNVALADRLSAMLTGMQLSPPVAISSDGT